MDTQTTDARVGWNLKKAVVFGSGTLLLVGTWCFLFVMIAAMTEGWLVPWDCICAPERPPLGTWARTANDFFEVPPGSVLPGVVFIVASASIFVVGTARTTNRALLPWALAATNVIFFLVDSFLVIRAHQLPDLWVPQPRPPIDVGYHRTWPAIVITIALLMVVLVVQSRVATRRKRSIGQAALPPASQVR